METKIKVNTERLENLNNGTNFLNIEDKQSEKENERYYINVYLDSHITLKHQSEELRINTNLPFISWSYYETKIDEFLEQLEKFCKNPLAVVNTTNRKEKISYY